MKCSTKILLPGIALAGTLLLAGNTIASSDETQSGTPKADAGMAMMPMHGQMQRMHEQMMKIKNASNPEEKQALMREHMTSMQGMMKMMHGMMAGQHQGGKHHKGSGKSPMNSPCADGGRISAMEQRMNMMQLMMGHMLENQGAQTHQK